MIVKMEKADPAPTSSNCEIYNNWMVKLKEKERKRNESWLCKVFYN